MTVTQDSNVLSISGEQFRTALNLETAQLTRYEALGADGTFHALIVPGKDRRGVSTVPRRIMTARLDPDWGI